MSYTVDVWRKTISGAGNVTGELAVLGGIVIAFSLFALWVSQRRAKRLK